MDSIVLKPCRFRGDVVVPVKNAAAKTYTWNDVMEELVPDENDPAAKINLRFVRTGDYVGVRNKSIRGNDVLTSFVISNRGNKDFGWLYKRHPNFPETVETIYRVESVHWPLDMVTEPVA
jgi:hypothetical protein